MSSVEGDDDLDAKYPNRPHNFAPTPPFHILFESLFNPLNDNRKQPTGPSVVRSKLGLRENHGGIAHMSPHERRRVIIERFISRWRRDVGNDIYPAFRLIIPERDRDRAMYGLKEKAIGKILLKVLKIDRNSEDAQSLLNWKLPGLTYASRMAGDFAGRCFEVISKRPMRSEVGTMSIEEVNDRLDKLSAASRENEQLPIFADFYRRMNPEELTWIIRIILRQMKIGATERTLFNIWHPDAEILFSISSSLRRVCWELWDPNVRLEGEDVSVTLMQCFQPQLAQFQTHSFQRIVDRMRLDEDDSTFWIEEKMDGERMQLHMAPDNAIPGGKSFRFWSRKAKDYTYLYGNGLYDENGALTKYLKHAFAQGVRSIILDGEMIAWDHEQKAPVPFGTLKSAAIAEQRNPFSVGQRPLYRIFDILYLNSKVLTRYTLRDRRRALEASIIPVKERFEIHPYEVAHSAAEIEPQLRKVVAEASEGLVLKNPGSPYRLNERHDDWMKVKPEYMTEFGESLDCVVIGGYYGSGKRGGILGSFLCGLRVDESQLAPGSSPAKFYSFFKVGGGFSAVDYVTIGHHTDGKWKNWDAEHPPTTYIELGGGDAQYERPDVWIKPDESFVVCVKAASITSSDQFRLGLTLRFPRFKRFRPDKDWKTALSVLELLDLKSNLEHGKREAELTVDRSRKKRATWSTKKELTVAGYDDKEVEYVGPRGKLFDDLNFYVVTESVSPKQSKAELEQLIKANGGKIFQTNTAAENIVCIADRKTIKAASLEKRGDVNLIRPLWIFDCLEQARRDSHSVPFCLPLEPRHMFFATKDKQTEVAGNVDKYSDSYMRDVDSAELQQLLDAIPPTPTPPPQTTISHLQADLLATDPRPPAWLFVGSIIYLCSPSCSGCSIALAVTPRHKRAMHSTGISIPSSSSSSNDNADDAAIATILANPALYCAAQMCRFAGARIASDLRDPELTHVVVGSISGVGAACDGDGAGSAGGCDSRFLRKLRRQVAERDSGSGSGSSGGDSGTGSGGGSGGGNGRVPHVVSLKWVKESWRERTVLDEERFAPEVM